MSTDARYSDVLAEVRKVAAGWPKAIEVEYGFTTTVAKALGLDYDGARTYEWDRFGRQVYRALNALVTDGTLVKTTEGRSAKYRTPAQHEARMRELDEFLEGERALIARGEALRGRLAALSLTGMWSAYGHTGVVLDLDVLEGLLTLAEKAEDTF